MPNLYEFTAWAEGQAFDEDGNPLDHDGNPVTPPSSEDDSNPPEEATA